MWLYENEEYDKQPDDYQGFVYVITELSTGKKYIGKKNFWRPHTLPKNSKIIIDSMEDVSGMNEAKGKQIVQKIVNQWSKVYIN